METKRGSWISGAMAGVAMMLGGCFCSAGPGQTEASLYLSDAKSGIAIKAPTFTEEGAAVDASCGEPDAADPSLCTYQLLVLPSGVHTITVSAPGYLAQTVTVDTHTMDSVHLAVELDASK